MTTLDEIAEMNPETVLGQRVLNSLNCWAEEQPEGSTTLDNLIEMLWTFIATHLGEMSRPEHPHSEWARQQLADFPRTPPTPTKR